MRTHLKIDLVMDADEAEAKTGGLERVVKQHMEGAFPVREEV
jgi:hypothetical protein